MKKGCIVTLGVLMILLAVSCYGQDKKLQAFILASDLNYIPGDTLKADFYLPINYEKQENPVLIFIDGFGGDFRKSAHYTGWAKLAASTGFISVVYSSRDGYVRESFQKLIDFVMSIRSRYFINIKKISVYAGSGNVRLGLPLANGDDRIRGALMYYGSAKMESFRLDLPVLLVRAGLDNVQLNKEIDSLSLKAFEANAPYTLTNLNAAVHAFEDFSDDTISLPLIMSSLNFLKEHMDEKTQKHLSENEREIRGARELYQSNWKGAWEAYKQVLIFDPGNNEAERQAGNICIELREYQKALGYYDSALAHGNWRKGEIAVKKLYAYAKLNNVDAAIKEMRILKKVGWFKEVDYSRKDEYKNVLRSEMYKKFINE